MNAPSQPTIQQQIDEVQSVLLSRSAQVRQRKLAHAGGRIAAPDLGCMKSSLPILQAAVRTLDLVRDHADAVRAVIQAKRGRGET